MFVNQIHICRLLLCILQIGNLFEIKENLVTLETELGLFTQSV